MHDEEGEKEKCEEEAGGGERGEGGGLQWPQWRIHNCPQTVQICLVLLLLPCSGSKRNGTKNAAGQDMYEQATELPPNAMMSEKLTCM